MHEENTQHSPKFCTILYSVRLELDISVAEYVYLDMVYYLSRSGWCYKSLDAIARDLGLGKSAVYYMRNRLVKRGLLEIDKQKHVRTTDIYHNALAHHPYNVQKLNAQPADRSKSAFGRSKSEQNRSKTTTKNNNRNTIEAGNEIKRGEPSPAKERLRAMLKQKGLLRA